MFCNHKNWFWAPSNQMEIPREKTSKVKATEEEIILNFFGSEKFNALHM